MTSCQNGFGNWLIVWKWLIEKWQIDSWVVTTFLCCCFANAVTCLLFEELINELSLIVQVDNVGAVTI